MKKLIIAPLLVFYLLSFSQPDTTLKTINTKDTKNWSSNSNIRKAYDSINRNTNILHYLINNKSGGSSANAVTLTGNQTVAGVKTFTSPINQKFYADTTVLGPEIVTNGTFSSGLDGWVVGGTGSGWSSSTGALHGTGNTDTLTQVISVGQNRRYFVYVVASSSAGTLTMTATNLIGSFTIATGKNLYSFVAPDGLTGTVYLKFTPTSTYNGKLTEVSLKWVTNTIEPYNRIFNKDGGFADEARSLGLIKLADSIGYVNGGTYNYDWGNKTAGAQNTAIGWRSSWRNVTGFQNIAIGGNTLQNNITGSYNVAVGQGALFDNSSGHHNTAIGTASLQYSKYGNYNTAIGYYTMYSNIAGNNNTAFGTQTLQNNTNGSDNVGVGYQTLYSNTTGNKNLGMGRQTLRLNVSGEDNVGIGYQALYTSTASNNLAIGSSAGYALTTGAFNVAIGNSSVSSATTVAGNCGVGAYTLAGTTGQRNAAFGTFALRYNTTGEYNTSLGFQAGAENSTNTNTTGSNNTYVGALCSPVSATQYSYMTVIGSEARGSASNSIFLGRATDATRVMGTFYINTLPTAPSSATDTGAAGEIRFTATGIYICIATNTWVKATAATW